MIARCDVRYVDAYAIDVRARTDASIIKAIYTAQAIEEYCTTAQSFTLHAMRNVHMEGEFAILQRAGYVL